MHEPADIHRLFAERFALRPAYAHSLHLGGATGCAMVMLAGDLVRAGRCRRVLVNTQRHNTRALSLYRRLGFEVTPTDLLVRLFHAKLPFILWLTAGV